MAEIQLRIDQLALDTENPRITHSQSQREALQKVVKDQKTKLIRLAESIVQHGLNPINRMMVLKVSDRPKRFIALEGNRRVTALMLLNNPAAMTDIEAPGGMQRSFERLSSKFAKSTVEPIRCYEVRSRDEGRYWIELQHNGEDEGRGIVAWKPIVSARFRSREPAIQAFDMVMEHGGFSEDEIEAIKSGFSLTTLRRLIEDAKVQDLIGVSVKNGVLTHKIDPAEVIKPLRKMVVDIHSKKVDSRAFNKSQQMVDYVSGFRKGEKPDLTKTTAERPVEAIETREVTRAGRAAVAAASRKSPSPADRKTIVPKKCPINVTDNRISEIYRELQVLKLDEARNAVAVLLRVFLELSIDHFIESNGGSLEFALPNGQKKFKSLEKKLAEVMATLVKIGVPRAHFAAIERSINVKTSPLYMDLLHLYVHDRFATPNPSELTAAWDHAQPLFEKIWP